MDAPANIPIDCGDWRREYDALRRAAGLIDLSPRGRLCLLGADALRFLNGQVTNNVRDLPAARGCYAALVSDRGRMESDLNIHCLENELLLDFEPGLAEKVRARLEKYIVAEDVQIVDAAPLYGMLRLHGPAAARIIAAQKWPFAAPSEPWTVAACQEIYLTHREGPAFDLFAPAARIPEIAKSLLAAGAVPVGWRALETVRIEDAVPRFGADMDETTIPNEAGIESRAISYAKGCYIGQEIIARIHTHRRVARMLRGLRLEPGAPVPAAGVKLFIGDKEAGRVTSAVESPALGAPIALGCVARESAEIGTSLLAAAGPKMLPAKIVTVPFSPFTASESATLPA